MFQNPYMAQYQQPYTNPYQARLEAMSQPQMAPIQHYDIITVSGENGARAFRMAPNSRCLLLDETNPIVWLAQTDGAGYPTLTPYSITPYQQQAQGPTLEDRIGKLEEIIYGNKSNASNAQQQAAGSPAAAEQPMGNAPAIPAVSAANGRP